MSTTLAKKLADLSLSWDHKNLADLQAFSAKHQRDACYLSALLQGLQDANKQGVASWLLKNHVDNGHVLTHSQQEIVLAAMPQAAHWLTRLHYLQLLPAMRVTAVHKESIYRFLLDGIQGRNKFVRAWSYSGLLVLAQQHLQYQDEAQAFARMALRDEAPSVKARLRNFAESTSFSL